MCVFILFQLIASATSLSKTPCSSSKYLRKAAGDLLAMLGFPTAGLCLNFTATSWDLNDAQ